MPAASHKLYTAAAACLEREVERKDQEPEQMKGSPEGQGAADTAAHLQEEEQDAADAQDSLNSIQQLLQQGLVQEAHRAP